MTCINRTLWRDSLGIGPNKIWAQKLPIYDDFATQWQLWGPVSQARNTIETIRKRHLNPEGFPMLSQNFISFGPLTAIN